MNAVHTPIVPTRRKHIALYSDDPSFSAEVSAKLNALAIYNVEVSDTSKFVAGVSADRRPTLVILDVADGALLNDPRITTARATLGSVPIIAVSNELSAAGMRNLVRVTPVDWLRKPVDVKELLNVVTFQESGHHGARSRILTFISASGGAGATTMALSAAGYLSRKSRDHAAGTCLVDLDFQRANCGGYLNLFNEFDLNPIVKQPERLDVELMDVIKLSRDPGFTLYSFERPSLPFEATGSDFVLKLLDLVAYRFTDVVVDLPYLEAPWHDVVLSTSDEVFIVFELNIASLRQAKRLYTRIRELRGNSASVTLVANKHKRRLFGNHFSRGELEKVFKLKNIRSITFDRPLLTDALNRALLPHEIHASARFNKDLNAMFRERLDGKKS